MSKLGRALQFLGLLLLPMGLIQGFSREDTRTEIALLVAGGAVFLVGMLLDRKRAA